jgi:adenosine deaminase
MQDAFVKRFYDSELRVTINSDDPAYFGSYVLDNYLAVAEHLDMTARDLAAIARMSLEVTFLPEKDKAVLLA